ncbi:unnamed protein product [Moneuplotes crassus]|uniref:Uncharacterized protein n=1 Tax=Euplotes crassus TaxID=5936 RepID=A0AAD1UGE6_EUPCR|nr:unnamed protein product [Moneuplotes crassus]
MLHSSTYSLGNVESLVASNDENPFCFKVEYISDDNFENSDIPQSIQLCLSKPPNLNREVSNNALFNPQFTGFIEALPEVGLPDFSILQNFTQPKVEEKSFWVDKANTGTTKEPSIGPPRSESPTATIAKEASNVRKRRWGKTEDKLLFQAIRDMEAEHILTLDELLTLRIDPNLKYHDGVQELCDRSGWRSKPEKLIVRIQKISKLEFSVREIKKLKKALRVGYKYENTDFDKVIYDFPGKTVASLQRIAMKLRRSFLQKNLTSFSTNLNKSVQN